MHRILASFVLALTTACAQVHTPGTDKILSDAAKALEGMPFDANAPVSVQGRLSTLVWPEGSDGMIVIEAQGGEKYAFSTARVAKMAKQGFTRFTAHPGDDVIVSGVLTKGREKIGPGLTAARADMITKADGARIFDRSSLP